MEKYERKLAISSPTVAEKTTCPISAKRATWPTGRMKNGAPHSGDALTPEELTALGHLSDDLYLKEVAALMGLSARSVERLLHSARVKLGARTNYKAVRIAIERGLI